MRSGTKGPLFVCAKPVKEDSPYALFHTLDVESPVKTASRAHWMMLSNSVATAQPNTFEEVAAALES